MSTETSKIVHTELKGILTNRFEIIKSSLGIQNDAEVVRYLIQNYYREKLEPIDNSARKEVEKDQEIIKSFMEKYGPEWRKLGE
jgi:hypothetical protein